ncbi:MAG: DnaD domain protein [Oscillospiraceae bacterium]|nr:DnaD domain protein [Oscillospiraceae bacterium]
MAYTVEKGMWRAVFAVPNEIVDTHLKMLGDVPLRVLLVLLRYDGALEAPAISAMVGKPETIVGEALDALISAGILSGEACPPALTYVQENTQEQPVPSSERKITTLSKERRKLARGEIGELSAGDENIGWLLQESQAVLGKTLNFVATETITALYSYYGMKPDIILMVLQYCAGIGKTGMPYIEKVASSWYEKEIETHEQAEAEIQRLKQAAGNESRIKSAFGIFDRNLSSKEKNYISTWINDYGFDVPMIVLAFERTVDAIHKLSFSYINKILSSWHEENIKTPEKALGDKKKPRDKQKAAAKAKESSYDLGELEQRLKQGIF